MTVDEQYSARNEPVCTLSAFETISTAIKTRLNTIEEDREENTMTRR